MNELVNKVGSCSQDNLISRLLPKALTTGITLAALSEAGTVKRGTLLAAGADGKYAIYGGAGNTKTAKFSGDATVKTFTISDKPASITSVKVGDTEAAIDDYNAYTGVVTLHAAPASGTNNVVVTYALGSAGTPSVILADDVEVGTSDDETAVAYISGNFNPDAVIVADGYTLTEEDYDALRKYGIIFTQML